MGSITEIDIINNLDIIRENLYNFNNTYLDKDYKYIKTNYNRFLNNINNSYLIKLKRSINMVAIKFSTILTESSYKNLEDIIFNQYYDIELYINNISNLIELSKIEILDKLNHSSSLLASIYNKTNIKIIGFYTVLNELIQKKLKNVNKEEYNNYRKLDSSKSFKEEIEEAFNLIKKFLISLNEDIEDEVEIEIGHDDLNIGLFEMTLFEATKEFNLSLVFEFNFPIVPTLDFVINIIPSISFEVGIKLTLGNENNISLNIDAYGQIEVGIKLEAALVFPSVKPGLKELEKSKKALDVPKITVAIGMEGTLISIKVGLKLSFILSEIQFEIDLYTEIKAFSFTFYCLFKFEFKIEILDLEFTFEFYLFKYEFNGISLEVHRKKTYNCLK
jgi:hypothetical protein